MPRLFSLAGIPSGELAFLRIFRRTDLMVAGGLPELVSGHFCQETICAMPNVGPCPGRLHGKPLLAQYFLEVGLVPGGE